MISSCFIKNAELRIISGEKWKAVRPTDSPIKLKLPAIRVVIAHTVTANCIDEVLNRLRHKFKRIAVNNRERRIFRNSFKRAQHYLLL